MVTCDTSVLALFAAVYMFNNPAASHDWLQPYACIILKPLSVIQTINKKQAIAISNTTSTATSSWQSGIQMDQQLEHQTIATCNLHSLALATITYPAEKPTHGQKLVKWWSKWNFDLQGNKPRVKVTKNFPTTEG